MRNGWGGGGGLWLMQLQYVSIHGVFYVWYVVMQHSGVTNCRMQMYYAHHTFDIACVLAHLRFWPSHRCAASKEGLCPIGVLLPRRASVPSVCCFQGGPLSHRCAASREGLRMLSKCTLWYDTEDTQGWAHCLFCWLIVALTTIVFDRTLIWWLNHLISSPVSWTPSKCCNNDNTPPQKTTNKNKPGYPESSHFMNMTCM